VKPPRQPPTRHGAGWDACLGVVLDRGPASVHRPPRARSGVWGRRRRPQTARRAAQAAAPRPGAVSRPRRRRRSKSSCRRSEAIRHETRTARSRPRVGYYAALHVGVPFPVPFRPSTPTTLSVSCPRRGREGDARCALAASHRLGADPSAERGRSLAQRAVRVRVCSSGTATARRGAMLSGAMSAAARRQDRQATASAAAP
jgi:hypothetical protein